MNKFKKKRKDKNFMATVTYAQLPEARAVIDSWWNVKGLPMPFLQQLKRVARCLGKNHEDFEELRKKLVDEYAQKDEDGQPIMRKDKDGKPTDAPLWTDKAALDAAWKELIGCTFDCPTLNIADLEDNAEKLGLALLHLTALDPIIVEDETNA